MKNTTAGFRKFLYPSFLFLLMLAGAVGFCAKGAVYIGDLYDFDFEGIQKGTMRISNVYMGKTIRVNRGDENVYFMRVRMEADQTDDIKISSITFFAQKEMADGSGYVPATSSDLGSFQLIYDTKVAGRAEVVDGFITFPGLDFNLPKGTAKEMLLTGDISKNTDARRFVFYLNSNKDSYDWDLNCDSINRMSVSGATSGLRPEISGEAYGSWFYVIPDPKLYQYEFTEDFSRTNYMDRSGTTADWNTQTKAVSLPAENGVYRTGAMAYSLPINKSVGTVTEAKLVFEEGETNMQPPDGYSSEGNNPQNFGITYSLSADGGLHWTQVFNDSDVKFEYPGNDLRWRAYLWTNASNVYNSPAVRSVKIYYSVTTLPINIIDVEEKFESLDAGKGEKEAKLSQITLSNTSSEDFVLYGIDFRGQSEGVYGITKSDLEGAYLYIKDNRIGTASISDDMEITFSPMDIIVPARGSITLVLKGDIPESITSKVLRFMVVYDPDFLLLRSAKDKRAPEVRQAGAPPFLYIGDEKVSNEPAVIDKEADGNIEDKEQGQDAGTGSGKENAKTAMRSLFLDYEEYLVPLAMILILVTSAILRRLCVVKDTDEDD